MKQLLLSGILGEELALVLLPVAFFFGEVVVALTISAVVVVVVVFSWENHLHLVPFLNIVIPYGLSVVRVVLCSNTMS